MTPTETGLQSVENIFLLGVDGQNLFVCCVPIVLLQIFCLSGLGELSNHKYNS